MCNDKKIEALITFYIYYEYKDLNVCYKVAYLVP